MAQEYGISMELVRDVKGVGAGMTLYAPEPPPPPEIATLPSLSAAMIAGRVRCVECSNSYFLGQDAPSAIPPAVTQAGIQSIADCGFAQFPYKRAFTDSGQGLIGEILTLNPDFRWLCYWQFGHATTYEPGASRQLDQDVGDLLRPRLAKDTVGNDYIAWINSEGVVTTYWANYCDDNGDADTALIDAHVGLLKDAVLRVAHKPSAFLIDHFSQVASGHWQQPTQGAPLDLLYDVRQPSVAYQSDPAQQALFNAQQVYWQQAMLDAFSDNALIIANGNGAWPASYPAMQAVTHGWFMEGFGQSPWSTWDEPDETMQALWDGLIDAPEQYLPYTGRSKPIFATDLRAQYTMVDPRADLARHAALMFDGWWKYRPLDEEPNLGDVVESELDDAVWDDLVTQFGTPTAAPLRELWTGLIRYSREFAGGRMWIVIDPTKLLYTQILLTGAAPTTHVSLSGHSTVDGNETVGASANFSRFAESQVKAYNKSTGDIIGGWSGSFNLSGGGTLSAPVGTYQMYIRARDVLGMTTPWASCGTADSTPTPA